MTENSLEPKTIKHQSFLKLLKKSILFDSNYIMGTVSIIIIIIATIVIPRFGTLYNLQKVFVQMSTTGLMAIGLTFVLITGGIDLSSVPVMACGAILGATFMKDSGNIFAGILIMLIFVVICGLFNGFAVAKLGMIPFVVTLATQVVWKGFASWYTQALSVFPLPENFANSLDNNLWIIPIPVIIFAFFAYIAHFILSKTQFGRWVYAVGVNIRTARVSGIPIKKTLFFVYIISSFFAGIAAVLMTARMGSAGPSMIADTKILDVICAAVIGGVSVWGGVGTAIGAAFGALLMSLITNIMNLSGVTYYFTLMIKGLVIILATFIDSMRRRARQ